MQKRRVSSMLPILAGVVIGGLLFLLGDRGDAPGLSLVGLIAAFLLMLWGLYNAGIIKKNMLAPILLLCFGVGGALLFIVLMLDGELNNSPESGFIGVALGLALATIGGKKMKKSIKNK